LGSGSLGFRGFLFNGLVLGCASALPGGADAVLSLENVSLDGITEDGIVGLHTDTRITVSQCAMGDITLPDLDATLNIRAEDSQFSGTISAGLGVTNGSFRGRNVSLKFNCPMLSVWAEDCTFTWLSMTGTDANYFHHCSLSDNIAITGTGGGGSYFLHSSLSASVWDVPDGSMYADIATNSLSTWAGIPGSKVNVLATTAPPP